MQKITPHLWFDNQAEEAMDFYVSLFEDSKILSVSRYEVDAPESPGTVVTATFQLAGQEFMALNGGPYFKFNEAISLFVNCETQAEVDELWEKLSAGGEEQQCGWLKDKYGLSWQIVPTALGELPGDPDPRKAQNVMQAMLQMRKIDIAALQRAYEQDGPTSASMKTDASSRFNQAAQQESDLPRAVGNPARQALVQAGYGRLELLTGLSEGEIKQLHGVGPKAIAVLRDALAARGLSFAAEEQSQPEGDLR